VAAAANGNAGFLKRLFGDRMFEVQPDGHVAAAAEMLEDIATRKPGQLRATAIRFRSAASMETRRFKPIAGYGGARMPMVGRQWRVTRVFVRQEGNWREVAGAMTPITHP
jgi:hypothetical protein